MKSIKIYITIFLAILIFTSCKKQTRLDLSGTYIIKSGESFSIPINQNLANISASDFTDSRCPINANCVWAGAGTVKLKFNDNNKAQLIELCIGACSVISKPKTQEIVLNNIYYTLELIDLSPYPGDGQTNQPAKATILLKKK